MTSPPPITSHVLDTALGHPARGLAVRLDKREADGWTTVGRGATDEDGRIRDLLGEGRLEAAVYRVSFDTAAYFEGQSRAAFYPQVDVVFRVERPDEHHHIPLLLSPFGYTTYRGS
jgi:5-hydroxyisourate hydrolase